mgnify:CR=1 FL=1
MRPKGRYRTAHLEVGREHSHGVLCWRLIVDDLFVFNVVGNLPAVGNAAFEVSRACKMSRTSGDQRNIDISSTNFDCAEQNEARRIFNGAGGREASKQNECN